jgi:hypothetical protein
VIEVPPTVVEGPLRTHLSVWLDEPHPHVFADEDVERGWRLGADAGRVYLVYPFSREFEDFNLLVSRSLPTDPRFREVRRTVFDDTLVGAVVSEQRYEP